MAGKICFLCDWSFSSSEMVSKILFSCDTDGRELTEMYFARCWALIYFATKFWSVFVQISMDKKYYYIDTDEIPGFFHLRKNHIFTARSEDTIFIFHVYCDK